MSLDTKIITDCKKGKAAAQDKIYDLYSRAMLATCARYAKDIPEAEDILQEAFIKVFTKMSKYDFETVSAFSAWMKRVVVNTALNYIRANKKQKLFTDLNENTEMYYQETPQEEPQVNISQKEILALIQKLPAGYKLVFNLFVFEKYSHQDIATELNISVNTSKTQLFKARKMLQKKVLEAVKHKERIVKESV